MIVGATGESDYQILKLTAALYRKYGLKRVFYSAYIPVNPQICSLDTPPPLLREHRLYQADWLLRFYGFSVDEIVDEGENLSMEFDPKCAWALRNMHLFPVEINRAPLEMLLRVPGIGAKNAQKIMQARRYTKLSFEDLTKMRVALKRAKHFITCGGKFFGEKNEHAVRGLLAAAEKEGEKCLSIKGDQGVKIAPLSVHGLVRQKQYHDHHTSRKEAPDTEYSGQNKQHYSHKFESIAKLVAPLRKVGDSHKSHIEYDLGDKPADAHRKVAEYQSAHHR